MFSFSFFFFFFSFGKGAGGVWNGIWQNSVNIVSLPLPPFFFIRYVSFFTIEWSLFYLDFFYFFFSLTCWFIKNAFQLLATIHNSSMFFSIYDFFFINQTSDQDKHLKIVLITQHNVLILKKSLFSASKYLSYIIEMKNYVLWDLLVLNYKKKNPATHFFHYLSFSFFRVCKIIIFLSATSSWN